MGLRSEAKNKMPAILRVETGSCEGLGLIVRPGETTIVGRRGGDLSIPEDTAMSVQHFSVLCAPDGRTTLRDLNSSNGTFVNGKVVAAATLAEQDRVDAGRTVFRFALSEVEPRLERTDLLKVLRGFGDSLYAVLDAARDPQILELLRESYAEYESLYEGKSAEDLVDYAPYLTRPALDPALLDLLVTEGWGKSWGVYFSCPQPVREVRKHLRQFLMVQIQDRAVYFRFYDPRVLRIFLPTCASKEASEFFGPIEAYFAEGEDPEQMISLRPDARPSCLPRLGSVTVGVLG
jgi:Domain of unknown function (DUF4123)/FHA domain